MTRLVEQNDGRTVEEDNIVTPPRYDGVRPQIVTPDTARQGPLGKPVVWMAGYSNDVMGYIPSLRVLKEGGYEGGGAMIYGSHPTRWSDKTEENIVGTVMELRKMVE